MYRVSLLKILNVSEAARTPLVPCSSDVFATQKLVIRTPKDGRDINQKRVLYKTRLFPTYTEVCREKVYTDVRFWARMAVVLISNVFALQTRR